MEDNCPMVADSARLYLDLTKTGYLHDDFGEMGCHYLAMLRLKLIHVCKMGPGGS